MSWTKDCTESSIFRVKNNNEVRKVLETLGFVVFEEENKSMYFISEGEGTYFDDLAEVMLSLKPITVDNEETNFVGVLSDCLGEYDKDELLENNNLKEEDVMIVNIIEYMQDQLLNEEQCMSIINAGFDGNTSGNFNPFGYALLITKSTTRSTNLKQYIEEQAKELGVKYNEF